MKKGLSIFLMLIICTTSFSQNIPDSTLNTSHKTSSYYLKKSKNQKTGGIVMLVSSVVIGGLGGAHMGLENMNLGWGGNQVTKRSATGPLLIALGSIGIVGSIFILNAASKNKKRAMLVTNNQSTPITGSFSLQQTNIGISISLGK
jgi:hypothetical protein